MVHGSLLSRLKTTPTISRWPPRKINEAPPPPPPFTLAPAEHMPCRSLEKHKDCFDDNYIDEEGIEPNLVWSNSLVFTAETRSRDPFAPFCLNES